MGEVISIPAITAEELVKDVILSDELPTMRQHLREMADAFLLTDEVGEYRHKVYCTYMNLDHFLAGAERLAKFQERKAS